MKKVVLVVALCVASQTAAASPGVSTAPGSSSAPGATAPNVVARTAVTVKESYRSQLILADLASIGLVVYGVLKIDDGEDGDEALAPLIVGSLGFYLSGPLIHASHGNGKKAWGSLALRVTPALIGSALMQENDDAAVPVGLLLILGHAIDYAIGYTERVEYRDAPSFSPVVNMTREGTPTFGLGATF